MSVLLTEALATAQAQAATQLRAMYHRLLHNYGPQRWWPSDSPLETIVGAYLTQNTSWRNVERSIANLKAAGAMSLEGLRALSLDDLRTFIRPSGYMIRKSLALQAFLHMLDRDHNGSLASLAADPQARESLLRLPGVGPETADAILLYALDRPVMVVDEYLRRVVTRHGLLDERARYPEIQQLALAAFRDDAPPTLLEHYNEFHALIVEVGKSHCRGVARCQGCPLNEPRFTPPIPPVASQAPNRRRPDATKP